MDMVRMKWCMSLVPDSAEIASQLNIPKYRTYRIECIISLEIGRQFLLLVSLINNFHWTHMLQPNLSYLAARSRDDWLHMFCGELRIGIGSSYIPQAARTGSNVP